eukprot:TRINITY_DN7579_c0_g1_i1.p1 TRINITY_DN7579_c0_g1~~TRINITY_DN7579_c0_g1_i1.p1  ORF type:complete len:471 (-),score=55.89 TRINITY_DN7579_c0_g1_i1:29-1441(-)
MSGFFFRAIMDFYRVLRPLSNRSSGDDEDNEGDYGLADAVSGQQQSLENQIMVELTTPSRVFDWCPCFERKYLDDWNECYSMIQLRDGSLLCASHETKEPVAASIVFPTGLIHRYVIEKGDRSQTIELHQGLLRSQMGEPYGECSMNCIGTEFRRVQHITVHNTLAGNLIELDDDLFACSLIVRGRSGYLAIGSLELGVIKYRQLAHQSIITSLLLLKDRRTLVSSDGHSVKWWSVNGYELVFLGVLVDSLLYPIHSLGELSDGLIVCSNTRHGVAVWDLAGVQKMGWGGGLVDKFVMLQDNLIAGSSYSTAITSSGSLKDKEVKIVRFCWVKKNECDTNSQLVPKCVMVIKGFSKPCRLNANGSLFAVRNRNIVQVWNCRLQCVFSIASTSDFQYIVGLNNGTSLLAVQKEKTSIWELRRKKNTLEDFCCCLIGARMKELELLETYLPRELYIKCCSFAATERYLTNCR